MNVQSSKKNEMGLLLWLCENNNVDNVKLMLHTFSNSL